MLPADDRFDAWFTNREVEIAAWRDLMHTPAGEVAPSQVYIGVTGSGKTHLRRRFEQLSRSAGVPSVTIELDRVKEGRDTVDVAMLAHRMIVALNIDAPRTTLALLRIASMESGDPVQENAMMSELGSAVLSTGFDAIISKLSTISITGIATVLLKQAYEKIKRDKQALQIYLRTEDGDADRTWTLSQSDSATVRRDVFRRLAEDIAVNPRRPEHSVQIVLFLDSGEHGGEEMPWLDRLLHAMSTNEAPMLVAAIFGQTNVTSTLPADRLVRNYLEGFLRHDAVAYCMQKRGLSAAVTEGLLPEAREDADEERYHVYSLGLLCDAALDDRGPPARQDDDQHYSRPEALSRRFLRRLELHEQGFLRRLALVPTFDEDAACHACDVGPDAERRAALMKWLRSFSFVQSAGDGLWRLHAVMRRVLAETSSDEDNLRRHQEWLKHWATRRQWAMDEATSRAWYHLFALGLEEAMMMWNGETHAAIRELRTVEHAWLVNLLGQLIEGDLLGGRPPTPEDRAASLNDWAIQLEQATIGDRRAQLEQAISAFHSALETRTRSSHPSDWAATQSNLGVALTRLGDIEGSPSRHVAAIRALQASLTERTRDAYPTEWAVTQCNLGNALGNLGMSEGGPVHLEMAKEALESALEVFSRDSSPAWWAMAHNSLGIILRVLGERESDPQRLEEAVAVFRAALEVYTRGTYPGDWAMVQSNLGNALGTLGHRLENSSLLNEAVIAFEAALEVYTRDSHPILWATMQSNLGGVLATLGEREVGTHCLERSAEALRAALEVRTREAFPTKWAMTLGNLAGVLLRTGEREQGTKRIEEAVSLFRSVGEAFTREEAPVQWAMNMTNLGATLLALAEREQGTERLEEAIAACREALKVFTREAFSYQHEQVSRTLHEALRLVAERRWAPHTGE